VRSNDDWGRHGLGLEFIRDDWLHRRWCRSVGTFAWWFRTFSEKWLNAKFEERLAAYKHEQQKELEHFKFSINAQMDRATKLHQRYVEALPEAWARLMRAHGFVISLVSRLQSTPDPSSMRSDQLEDFLTSSKLAEWQQQSCSRCERQDERIQEPIRAI
jgi:hypothetical protein